MKRSALLLVGVLGVSCATTTTPRPGLPMLQTEVPAAVVADLPQDPVDFVKLIMREPTRIDALVDMSFVTLLDRAQGEPSTAQRADVAAMLATVVSEMPARCTMRFQVADGYEAVAIPPPMNDQSAERIAWIEQAIEGLRAGQEVHAYCQDEEGDELMFAVNLLHEGTRWNIRGWRGRSP